ARARCASVRWRPAATSSSTTSTRATAARSSCSDRGTRNVGMIGALIVVFREVFEAGLILGIVLAVTRDVPGRSYWVSGGVVAGAIVAVFAERLSEAFAGAGQELFTAIILGIAVVMLSWHNVWMARHGRQLAAEMRHQGEAVASGSKPVAALALVVAVAVLREGFEVVLFLYAMIMQE